LAVKDVKGVGVASLTAVVGTLTAVDGGRVGKTAGMALAWTVAVGVAVSEFAQPDKTNITNIKIMVLFSMGSPFDRKERIVVLFYIQNAGWFADSLQF
jgi:hypothetical protein